MRVARERLAADGDGVAAAALAVGLLGLLATQSAAKAAKLALAVVLAAQSPAKLALAVGLVAQSPAKLALAVGLVLEMALTDCGRRHTCATWSCHRFGA